jgi:hypothetical protein
MGRQIPGFLVGANNKFLRKKIMLPFYTEHIEAITCVFQSGHINSIISGNSS